MADEYIRKQDAVNVVANTAKIVASFNYQYAIDALSALTPADVVQVCNCKDCGNWQTDWNPSIPDRHYCAVMDSMMKADDFCSYGEKREE